jgi:transposase InsO family protein/transposase-like protein
MNACDNIVRLARELRVNRTLLYKWRYRSEGSETQSDLSIRNSRESTLRREIDKLKRLLANKTLEVEFFRTALQKAEARRRNSGISGEQVSTMQFETPLQGSLSVERMCQLGQVSRAGFYRYLQARAPIEEGMTERSAIQEIALQHRLRYGYRRITVELRQRGMNVNHKRVARIMRDDNLLTIRRRELPWGTDQGDEMEIYLNLANRLKVGGPNHVWIADITYIRLKTEFVYLAVVIDAFSRKVVGWALDRTLQARLPLGALRQAISSRQPPPGLVHHSDRGVQYACEAYLQMLREHQIMPSVSRPAHPHDNASCESFLKTLKREEIYANDYRDMEDLAAGIEEFIERYYNRCRPHSALGYRSPEEFEKQSEPRSGDDRQMRIAWQGAIETVYP